MWVEHKEPISQTDYFNFKNEVLEKIKEFVSLKAYFSGYPPQGYGIMDENIIEENGKYFAVWKCRDSCD